MPKQVPKISIEAITLDGNTDVVTNDCKLLPDKDEVNAGNEISNNNTSDVNKNKEITDSNPKNDQATKDELKENGKAFFSIVTLLFFHTVFLKK